MAAVKTEDDALPKVVWPVTPSVPLKAPLVAKKFVAVRTEVDALASVVWPVTLRRVAVVVASVVVPVTKAFPETERAVDDAVASVLCPVTFRFPDEKRPVAVKTEDDAFPSVVCPVTLSVPPRMPFVPRKVVEKRSVPVAFVKKRLFAV